MTDAGPFDALPDRLFQPEAGLYLLPIRHHSPACAWHLRAALRDLKPACVLIEGPRDFDPHIKLLLDPDTRPPVAIVSVTDPGEQQQRLAGYYPFCDHSPEFVALRVGAELGAELRFIDLAAGEKTLQLQASPLDPVPLMSEQSFHQGDYIAALARATGCRDGFELWDHLFEAQLGRGDWRGFFADVGTYCAGIRAATAPEAIQANGDAAREAQMAAAIAEAMAQGKGPVVAVVGGFHSPALTDPGPAKAPKPVATKSDSYLIRYGFRALDALNGYGAGLPQPGYYQALWARTERAGTPEWRSLAIDLLSDFAAQMRAEGEPISLPGEVEAIRMAEGLALMRGRPGALRHDLLDGVQAALIKGEAGGRDPLLRRFRSYLCGDRLGNVPASAGSPPLVEDVRRRARALRFDITDSQHRNRKLDIRRKPAHLEASQFCHAMTLLTSGFATREIGPDYINNRRTELLFEEWGYSWSPQVEGRLIELAPLGDALPAACLSMLDRARRAMIEAGQGRDIPRLVELFYEGLLAGLGEQLSVFLAQLASDIQNFGDFPSVADAMQKLIFTYRSKGPIGAPEALDLGPVLEAAYGRLVYLVGDLAQISREDVTPELNAIRVLAEILRDSEAVALDRTRLEGQLDRVARKIENPVILGAVLALCVQLGLRPEESLREGLRGQFEGVALDNEARIGFLRGLLHTAPLMLWHVDGLLEAVDGFLTNLSEEAFLELLPHLRLAFTVLGPREVDRLAKRIAGLHNIAAGEIIAQAQVPEAALHVALQIERAVRADLERDGLGPWLAGGRADG